MGKYGRPESVSWPKDGDQDVHHAVKLLEDDNLPGLEAQVNAWLLAQETATPYPLHVESMQLTHYSLASGPAPRDRFVMALHIIAMGNPV